MRFIDGLSKAQRVVVVIAFGLGLDLVGSFVVNLGSGRQAAAFAHGWSTAPPALSTGLPPLVRMIIWLVLIGLWALGSIWVLRTPGASDSPTGSGRG